MDKWLLWRLKKEEGTYICSDEDYRYYLLLLNGFSIMYRTNYYRDDGRRMYLINHCFARALGFSDERMLRTFSKRIWWCRRWLSPESLAKHIPN